jgi:hypothetical protein
MTVNSVDSLLLALRRRMSSTSPTPTRYVVVRAAVEALEAVEFATGAGPGAVVAEPAGGFVVGEAGLLVPLVEEAGTTAAAAVAGDEAEGLCASSVFSGAPLSVFGAVSLAVALPPFSAAEAA